MQWLCHFIRLLSGTFQIDISRCKVRRLLLGKSHLEGVSAKQFKRETAQFVLGLDPWKHKKLFNYSGKNKYRLIPSLCVNFLWHQMLWAVGSKWAPQASPLLSLQLWWQQIRNLSNTNPNTNTNTKTNKYKYKWRFRYKHSSHYSCAGRIYERTTLVMFEVQLQSIHYISTEFEVPS